MSPTIALQMFGADFLKLRKKRGTMVWATMLTILPLLVFFVVKLAQHEAGSPAGGTSSYTDAVRIVALFFGPLTAILIGADAGAGDLAAGVFRDLVVTGRSRLVLFATRVPAALALTWLVVGAGYAITLIGTYAFAEGSPTPDAALAVNGLLFVLFATGVICVVAVGLASLTGSRPATLTALIGWQLVASPIFENISSLGNSRKLVLRQAIVHFSPISITDSGGGGGGHHGGPFRAAVLTMSTTTAVLVTLAWIVLFTVLGAWRTRTMDA
jgi:ABC-type transport system involved in multi-copper enzyme maturation permease subunit